eukprot:COSAG06_NODE_938_length_11391_cov_13.363974_3_plen_38_part_00
MDPNDMSNTDDIYTNDTSKPNDTCTVSGPTMPAWQPH